MSSVPCVAALSQVTAVESVPCAARSRRSRRASSSPPSTSLVPYEPGKPVEEVQRELGLERVVKLASNEGPFGPFPAAVEAIERVASRELNRYPDGGVYRLRAALAERLGVALRAGHGRRRAPTGSSTASRRPSLDPGDEIVCGWPSFPSYVIDARKVGADAASPCRCATAATTSTRCSTRSGRARRSSTSATRTTRPGR